MRYEVYDEDGKLFRKFWTKWEAVRFMQPGWKLVTKSKVPEQKPTVETHGEALW
jgi:sugar lactone lactonase YvrE